MPYDLADPVDFFVFSVRTHEHFGQFVFPKTLLFEKGIISREGRGGKRAIRAYPPWIATVNRQAKNAQAWQEAYFFEIQKDKAIGSARVRALFS